MFAQNSKTLVFIKINRKIKALLYLKFEIRSLHAVNAYEKHRRNFFFYLSFIVSSDLYNLQCKHFLLSLLLSQ